MSNLGAQKEHWTAGQTFVSHYFRVLQRLILRSIIFTYIFQKYQIDTIRNKDHTYRNDQINTIHHTTIWQTQPDWYDLQQGSHIATIRSIQFTTTRQTNCKRARHTKHSILCNRNRRWWMFWQRWMFWCLWMVVTMKMDFHLKWSYQKRLKQCKRTIHFLLKSHSKKQ